MQRKKLKVLISPQCFVFFCILFLLSLGLTTSLSYEEELTLTAKEKSALDEFKAIVIPKIPSSSYIQNYINDDLYFIRWLRGKNLNIKAAVQQFMKHLKWRDDEKIDTIDREDWSEFERDLPIYVDTEDKEGRPIVEIWFGDWETRNSILTGKQRLILRWVARFYEILNRRIYDGRAAGKNATQAIFMADLEGFSIAQQGCISCASVYVQLSSMDQVHYPRIWHRIYLLNTPPSFDLVLRAMYPVLGGDARTALKSYVSKRQWLPVLNETIAEDQRSIRFGGTLVRDQEN